MAKRKTNQPVAEGRKHRAAAIHDPTHAEIQERAYYRYVDRGRIDGLIERTGASPRLSFAVASTGRSRA